MSIKRTTAVWEHSTATANDLLALLAIADHADDDGFAWPAIDRIAAKSRVSKRTAYRILDRLQAAGELYIERAIGRANTNQYLVLLGLTDEEIARTLQQRFGKTPEEVAQILHAIHQARQKGDNLTPFSEPEKGVTAAEKVSPLQEKVSPVTKKGDTGVTRTVKEPSREPSLEPPVVGAPPARPTATAPAPADHSSFQRTDTRTATTNDTSPPDSAHPPSPEPEAVQLHLAWIQETYDRSRRQWPNRAQREQIAREVTDLERWRRNLKAWSLKGYSSGKVDGQLDFYHRDEASQVKPVGRLTRPISPEEAKKSKIDLRVLKPTGTGGKHGHDR